MSKTIFSSITLSIAFLIASISFQSCDEQFEEIPAFSHEYYPSAIGKYRIYQIDSIVYDEYNCNVDSLSYQLKEVVVDTSSDGTNMPYFILNRYIRKDALAPWTLTAVWKEQFINEELHRIENNLRTIALVFPVDETMSWDGIVYIRRDTLIPIRGGSIDMFKDWDDFSYANIDAPRTVAGINYNETVEIQQVDKINNIERRFSSEVYAKGVGLVLKEQFILDTQCRVNCEGVGDISTCINTPWIDKAERGFILKQTLIDHN